MSVLGRYLELSVRAPDVLASLSFYKTLGFTELTSGDVWPHRYAVVSDGELCIGLHDRELEAPALAFVHPDLARHSRSMADHGIEFAWLRIDEDHFNELGFADPNGHLVTMLEARTFSPSVEELDLSACGRLLEISLPVRNAVASGRFWAPLAPVLKELREEPTTHMRLDAGGLPLGLSESIALERPSLSFRCEDRARLDALAERHGIERRRYPGFEGAAEVLVAPEGTRLYLFDRDFLGESYIVEETGEYEALS